MQMMVVKVKMKLLNHLKTKGVILGTGVFWEGIDLK